jgi:hypothetical protein
MREAVNCEARPLGAARQGVARILQQQNVLAASNQKITESSMARSDGRIVLSCGCRIL